jgi:hypothetical protein
MRARLLMTTLLLAALACRAPAPHAPRPAAAGAPDAAPVLPLRGSLEPLRAEFNGARHLPRLVVFLSPTCPHCAEGARAVRAGLLEDDPAAPLHVTVVWLDVLPGDGLPAARAARARLADPRVHFFHDALGTSGRAFARGVLPVAVARHVFLLYAPGQEWGPDGPPPPRYWAHQLGRVRPEFYKSAEGLAHQLRESYLALGE